MARVIYWDDTKKAYAEGPDVRQAEGKIFIDVPAYENLNNSFVHLVVDVGTLKVQKADATDHTKPCNGYVEGEHNATDEVEVILTGLINLSGLTPEERYFLSTTPGEITTDPTSVMGNIIQYIGTAVDEDRLSMDIDEKFIISGDYTDGKVIYWDNDTKCYRDGLALDPDIKDAMTNANSPDSDNPFLTQVDMFWGAM